MKNVFKKSRGDSKCILNIKYHAFLVLIELSVVTLDIKGNSEICFLTKDQRNPYFTSQCTNML